MKTYVLFYRDGTTFMCNMEPSFAVSVCDALIQNLPAVFVPELGVLRLQDVRAFVMQETRPHVNEGFSPDLTEAEREYNRQMAWLAEQEAPDDTEYEGGMGL